MKTETLNIAILSSDHVAAQAIAMSKKIAEEVGSRFILNSDTLILHITVYQAQYPIRNIDNLTSIARNLSLEQKLFEITLDSITYPMELFCFGTVKRFSSYKIFKKRRLNSQIL